LEKNKAKYTVQKTLVMKKEKGEEKLCLNIKECLRMGMGKVIV